MVLLEAMQHGLLCITTDEGSIKDIIDNENTGLILPKASTVDLARAIERLINDRELCVKMGQAGYNKYIENFTLDIFEHRLYDIIYSLV